MGLRPVHTEAIINEAFSPLNMRSDGSISFIRNFLKSALPALMPHKEVIMQSPGFFRSNALNRFRMRILRNVLFTAVAMLFLAMVCAALGGEFWEKTDYRKWSQDECNKMLEDSPWSKALVLQKVGIRDSTDKFASNSGQPYIKYQFQLRCALPVRQAIVRQSQFAQGYDGFSPELRQKFDKNAESFINMDFSNVVIVYVIYSANSQPKILEVTRYWQSKTTELLKNSVYLRGSKGERTSLIRYVPPEGGNQEFQFLFPRRIDDKPIIGSQDKSIQLEFEYPVVDAMGNGRGYMEFKTDKMVFDGKVAY
jgi:hypothetical protein